MNFDTKKLELLDAKRQELVALVGRVSDLRREVEALAREVGDDLGAAYASDKGFRLLVDEVQQLEPFAEQID